MKSVFRSLGVCVCTTLLGVSAGCDRQADADAPAKTVSAATEPTPDAPVAAFQNELLDIAFKVATAIPVDPHIKDRSRAQEAVVSACLELKQPQRALEYIKKIEDWRQGAAYADLAFYYAQHGKTDQLERYLDRAGEIANDAEDWRRDRIKVKIARVHALLGDAAKAAQLEAGVENAETGKVDAVRAQQTD